METIRCPRCQKLLRADAQTCSRCGISIPGSKTPRKRGLAAAELTHPTSPLASPHRAGHYSGLHPEDQPFQSSFFVRIQRSPEAEVEAEDSSTVLDMLSESEPGDTGAELEALPIEPPSFPARPPLAREYEDENDTAAFSALADLPTLTPRRTANTPLPETRLPEEPRRPAPGPRLARLLITGSLVCFLLGTGLLAFLLLNRHPGQAQTTPPRLQALPGEVRVGDMLQLVGSGLDPDHVVALTRDSGVKVLDAQGQQMLPTTDDQGAFQIHVPITASWSIGVHTLYASEGQFKVTASLTIQAGQAGPPRLQLGASRLDLGGGNPGTLARKTMTLTNGGGGRVSWSAHSNAAWLSLSPASGSFVGNMVIELTANRANLAPQAYLGQIVFTQNQGATQMLYVAMTVNTEPANLVLSTASLAFAGTPVQSPAGQTIVIQNNGGQVLDWTAGTTTSDGGPWLSITPASGELAANTSAILTVNVATVNLALSTYQGALNFSYAGGPVQQVAISLNVTPPPQPAMHLSQQSLSFATNQGFNPPPQSFVISNPGNAPLNWTIHADAQGLLFLVLSASSGSVPPGQSVTVSVAPSLGSANGTIKSVLTVKDSDSGTNVPAQQVNVTIAITNQPVITVLSNQMTFDHSSGTTDTSTLLIFSNTGSLALNWKMTESAQVPWLSFDTTSGTLAAGQSLYINVRCLTGGMQPGTYTVTLTLKDTDAGSVVAAQSIAVTLTIST